MADDLSFPALHTSRCPEWCATRIQNECRLKPDDKHAFCTSLLDLENLPPSDDWFGHYKRLCHRFTLKGPIVTDHRPNRVYRFFRAHKFGDRLKNAPSDVAISAADGLTFLNTFCNL